MHAPHLSRAVLTVTALGVFIAGCANRTGAGESQDPERVTRPQSLVGEWRLASAPSGGGPGAGLQLDVQIDSVGSVDVYGSLTRFFSGDVGMDASRFSRFSGKLSDDSLVSFAISTDEQPPSAIAISGIVRADTITVTRFVLGPDTLVPGRRAWVLLRAETR